MINDCKGLVGLIFGHRFEGRYSIEETTFPVNTGHGWVVEDVERLIKASKNYKRTYHGDVCTRCGLRIDQTKPKVADKKEITVPVKRDGRVTVRIKRSSPKAITPVPVS